MVGSTQRADRGGLSGATESGRARSVVRCSFCHGPFARGDGPLSCRGCGGLLHEGCWYEAGRCPSLGCAGPGTRGRRARRPRAARARRRWRLVLRGFVTGVLLLPAVWALCEVVGRSL